LFSQLDLYLCSPFFPIAYALGNQENVGCLIKF
jgi:hypothetical protein